MTLQNTNNGQSPRPPIKSSRNNGNSPANSRPKPTPPSVGFLQLRAADPASVAFLTSTTNLLAVNVFGKGEKELEDRNLIPRYQGSFKSAIQMAYDTPHVLRQHGKVAAYTCDIVPIAVAAIQTIRCDDEMEHRRLHPNGNTCQGAECPLRKNALQGPDQQARLAALVAVERCLHLFQGPVALPTAEEMDDSSFIHPLEQKTGVPYGLVALAADVNADYGAKIGAVVQWLRYRLLTSVAQEAARKALTAYKKAVNETEVFAIYRSGQNPTEMSWTQATLDNIGSPILAYVVGDTRYALELGRSVARVVIVHQPHRTFRKDVEGSMFTVHNFIPTNADLNAARDIIGEVESWSGNAIFMVSNRNEPSQLPAEFVIDTLAKVVWQRKPSAQASQASEAEVDATA